MGASVVGTVAAVVEWAAAMVAELGVALADPEGMVVPARSVAAMVDART